MTPMLRTRRCASTGSVPASLPSYDNSTSSSSAHPLKWNSAGGCCPAPYHIDETQSFDLDEETDIVPIRITESMSYQELCRVKSKPASICKLFCIRGVMIVGFVAILGLNIGMKIASRPEMAPMSSASVSDNGFDSSRRLSRDTEQTQFMKSISNEVAIQQESEQLLRQQFGVGPHFVEFELNIWEGSEAKQHFFTIEMAPANIMPTAVLTFLQQVQAGLWSNTSIHLNAAHVIAARPVSGNGKVSKRDEFQKHGLLPFNEYSESYPHLAYTLGFVGAGPAFFINKQHNYHRDACFANVVIGRKTIDKIGAMRGLDSDSTRIRPVDIVATRILHGGDLNSKGKKEYLASTKL